MGGLVFPDRKGLLAVRTACHAPVPSRYPIERPESVHKPDTAMMYGQGFRKTEHLRKSADFARIFATRRFAKDGRLVVYVADNGLGWCRLGLSVGKRVGSAVVRNHIKRRIREAFRTLKAELPPGLDILCVARPGSEDRRYDVGLALCTLVGRAHQQPGARRRRHGTHGHAAP